MFQWSAYLPCRQSLRTLRQLSKDSISYLLRALDTTRSLLERRIPTGFHYKRQLHLNSGVRSTPKDLSLLPHLHVSPDMMTGSPGWCGYWVLVTTDSGLVLGNSYVKVVVTTSNRCVSFAHNCEVSARDIFLFTMFKNVYIPIWAATPPTPRFTTHS